MNTLKRSIIVVLLFAILMSILAIPALALAVGSSHYTNVSGFKELYNGSPLNAYIRAAQRFLLCYGGEARSNIISGGGVDGGYGYYTQEAVRVYQKDKWPYDEKEQDGRVGPKTWEKIAVDLEYSPGGGQTMTIYVLTAKKFCTLIPVQKDIVTTIIMEANMRGLKTVLSFQNN